MLQKLINFKNLFCLSTFGLSLFLMVACSESKNKSRSNSKSESTTASFTCKNCGGHSFKYHETVTDMKVCKSCGAGQ